MKRVMDMDELHQLGEIGCILPHSHANPRLVCACSKPGTPNETSTPSRPNVDIIDFRLGSLGTGVVYKLYRVYGTPATTNDLRRSELGIPLSIQGVTWGALRSRLVWEGCLGSELGKPSLLWVNLRIPSTMSADPKKPAAGPGNSGTR